MAKKYTVSTKGKNAGYKKNKDGSITSKKTGKTYKGKQASLAARKRRVMFSHMKKK